MRPSAVALLAASALLAACGSRPATRVLRGPAPEGALACAARELAGRGYEAYAGSVESGYLQLERGWDSPAASLISVARADGELRVEAATRDARNRRRPPDGATAADAEAVLARCAAARQ